MAARSSSNDIDELHNAHVSPIDVSAKVDKLGTRVADEIEQVMTTLAAAEGSASNYSANLARVSSRLGTARDREGVRVLVESLAAATKEMATTNVKLQDQMQAMWEEVAQLRRELETARTESLTDALTSLGNRKLFDAALEKSIAECHAGNEPLSLLLADIDHFKTINDTFGHVVGDRVLRFVGNTLKDTITGKDIAARYGGEEFAVIMPRTPLRAAVETADQLRLAVMKAELVRRSTGEKQTPLDDLDRGRRPACPHVAAGSDRGRRYLPPRRQAQRPQLRHRRTRRAAAHRHGGLKAGSPL